MRVLSWFVAALLLGMAALRTWAAVALVRRLHHVPPRRQRVARFIVLSAFSIALVGSIGALTVLLASYDPSGGWKMPIVIALGVGLILALPGLGMLLWRHHEPWIQEWRAGPRSSDSAA
jgi:hypothetical protein